MIAGSQGHHCGDQRSTSNLAASSDIQKLQNVSISPGLPFAFALLGTFSTTFATFALSFAAPATQPDQVWVKSLGSPQHDVLRNMS